jgi:hypothetical protein
VSFLMDIFKWKMENSPKLQHTLWVLFCCP